jgi:hypothetical protein
MGLELLTVSREPFEHFVLSEFYEAEFAEKLSRWLSSQAIWRRSVHHFYDQFELNFKDIPLIPESIAIPLLASTALDRVKGLAEDLFRTQLRPNLCVGAHKLIDGQGIGIHTDSAPGEESHRIVVQLSRDWQDSSGGHLVFFGSADVRDVRNIFRHIFNSAIGFSLGGASYHAVSNVLHGERFTIIYGFWSVLSEFDESKNAARTFAIE